MKKVILSLAVAALGGLSLSAGAKDTDPVLMTVNNKPVKLSEFEYLYQKNNAQQLTIQPIEEYLDLFVVYKLKVADAEAAGIAENDAFVNEFAGYRRDLSEPYLTNQAVRDSLVRNIYERMKSEVDVSHIMVEIPFNAADKVQKKAFLDSLRSEIIAGNADFNTVADTYSIDPGVRKNHGHMGYIVAGMFPYTFEDAAYDTKVGDISPVIETPFGYHIVKVNGTRPAQGQVKVQHILKFTRGLNDEDIAKKKAQVDSIYTLLKNGADFDDMARRESDDTGSARNGGNLDWFSTGRMVPEFEAASFALTNGEVSEPFSTAYGYHIVKRLDWKQIDSFEDLSVNINAMIDRDERQFIPVKAKTRELRAKYNTTINSKTAEEVRNLITANGQLDSALVARLAKDERVIISLSGDNGDITVGDVFEALPQHFNSLGAADANALIADRLETLADEAAIEAERDNLALENVDYRNLLNEYRDGMLLFEISDRNVWTRSKTDKEGINAYFNANKAKYTTWTAPKFKGYVVFATSDSIREAAQNYLAANNIDNDKLIETLRKEFDKNVKVERVLAAEGDNAIIDGLAFGKPAPTPTGKWAFYFAHNGKIIDQPEEVADERGLVTTDYQNILEDEWVKSLKKKYPVKINKKVLKQYKSTVETANQSK